MKIPTLALFIFFIYVAPPLVAEEGNEFVWYRKPGTQGPTRPNVDNINIEKPRVGTFFKKYCVDCHGPKKQKGDFRIDELPEEVKTAHELEQWQEVVDVLNGGIMPPEEKDQPSSDELLKALEMLHAYIDRSRSYVGISGNRKVRRLNRREYKNTIEDYLGVEIPLKDIPEDNAIGDFDTNTEALSMSPMQLNAYLNLANNALDISLKPTKLGAEGANTNIMVEGEALRNTEKKKFLKKIKKQKPKFDRIETLLQQGKGWAEIAKLIKKGDAKSAERDYKKLKTGYVESPWLKYDELSSSESGAIMAPLGYPSYLDEVRIDTLRKFPAGKYLFKVRVARYNENKEDSRFLLLMKGEDIIGRYEVVSQYPEVSEFAFEYYYDGNDENSSLKLKLELGQKIKPVLMRRMTSNFTDSMVYGLWVDNVEITNDMGSSSNANKMVFQEFDPTNFTDVEAKQILYQFANSAFRKQIPSKTYIEDLHGLYLAEKLRLSATERYPSFEALKLPLSVILSSPRFIYLNERETRNWITERDLAIRLSYFLWGGPPDEKLWGLVKNRSLSKPKVIVKTVDRMIAHPKFQRFIDGFTNQWLELDRLDIVEVDEKKFPSFTGNVKASAKLEPLEFVRYIFQKNLSLKNLIKSNFVVVDPTLSKFYNIPSGHSSGFKRVDVEETHLRGGLLTQSAILTLNTNGDRTSPVDRGAYILRKFLNWGHLEPPPNVPSLSIDGGVKDDSVRNSLMMHSMVPQCKICHQHIDPLGYGLENFNTVGLWQTEEVVEKKVNDIISEQRLPILTSGTMPGNRRPFEDFKGLQHELMMDSELLVRSLAKAMYTYSLGRSASVMDEPVVDEIVNYVKRKNYNSRALIHAVVASANFQSQ